MKNGMDKLDLRGEEKASSKGGVMDTPARTGLSGLTPPHPHANAPQEPHHAKELREPDGGGKGKVKHL